jgi:hypothetical protein
MRESAGIIPEHTPRRKIFSILFYVILLCFIDGKPQICTMKKSPGRRLQAARRLKNPSAFQ